MVQEKLDKTAANETRLDEENKQLRLNVDETENQLTTAELLRRSLDGENQRLKMVLADKETEIEARCVTFVDFVYLSLVLHSQM